MRRSTVKNSPTTSPDSSTISPSAHYTAYVWYRHGLSHPALASHLGRLAHWIFKPANLLLGKLIVGADIDTFLLQRHLVINQLLTQAIEQQGFTQILEIAAGLSGRGLLTCQKYPQVHYWETDLAAMVTNKVQRLERIPERDNARHHFSVCNILHTEGAASLEHLFNQQLDPQAKTLVITEGLVNYFPLASNRLFWQRLNQLLARQPAGKYLTEIYPELVDHPFYRFMRIGQKWVETLTRNPWPLLFRNDAEMYDCFSELGFSQCKVHDPAAYYQQLDIPRARAPTMVRIIEADS